MKHPKLFAGTLAALVMALAGIVHFTGRGQSELSPAEAVSPAVVTAPGEPAPRTEPADATARVVAGSQQTSAAVPVAASTARPVAGTSPSATAGKDQTAAARAAAGNVAAAGPAGAPAPDAEAAALDADLPPVTQIPDGKGGSITIDFTSDEARARTVAALREKGIRERNEAIAWAKANNWPLERKTADGNTEYLDRLLDGQPVYISLHNVNAAISNNVVAVREVDPYYLDGVSIQVAVWDGGQPQTTHQEFAAPGGSRVSWNAASVVGNTANRSHATHVMGTIAARGADSSALGMAPGASVTAYSFFDNTLDADMAALAAAMPSQAGYQFVPASAPYSMVSNHSYGYTSATLNGVYDSGAVEYDATLYAAPYHLGCFAAGNNNSNASLYSNIRGYSGAKNVLSVGNTRDAVTSGSRNFAGLAMNSDSSWGPMDDGRLKPDVSANGDGVYSSDFGSDSSYTTFSGTSMSTPSVAGGVALLQDHALREFGRALKASTIKAVLIHTADDIRNPGPDYQSGYGLVNIRAAADRIRAARDHPRLVYEGRLTGAGSSSEEVSIEPDGIGPVTATLCWADPEGTAQPNGSTTPVLVHDLTLRLERSEGTLVLPWVLNPASPATAATRGNDSLNNVEKVQADAAAGSPPWRAIVSVNSLSKPNAAPLQDYSLVLSGVRYAGTFRDAADDPTLAWTFSGSGRWGAQSSTTYDGRDALRSPEFSGTNQRSGFRTTVTGPGRLTFRYRTTGAPGDTLQFTGPAGVLTANPTEWTQHTVDVPAGVHQLHWEYVHGTGPQGYGYVDQVAFTLPPVVTSAFGAADFMIVNWSYPRAIGPSTVYRNTSPTLTGATASSGWSSSGNASGTGTGYISSGAGNWFAVEVQDALNGQISPLSAWFQGSIHLGFITTFSASDSVYADRVQLTWSAVSGATEYLVTRTPQGGATTQFTVTGTSYSDTAALPGQLITYTVQGRRPSDGALSGVSTDTGSRLDPATITVNASDGAGTSVSITWPWTWGGGDYVYNRVLRTANNISPNNGNNASTVISASQGRATDSSAVPGVTYWYWVQARIRDSDPWSPWGSDTGYASAPVEVSYAVSTTDHAAGPPFFWVEARNGLKLAGETLIKPKSLTILQGTEADPAVSMINSRGLATEPGLGNFAAVTHSALPADIWRTNHLGAPYFTAGGVAPQFDFDLGQGYQLTDLVVWGFPGAAGADEARTFRIEPLLRDAVTQALIVWPPGAGVTVSSPASAGTSARRIPLNSLLGNANGHRYYRVTITDNFGGGRVGLAELRFLGIPGSASSIDTNTIPSLGLFNTGGVTNASIHGYLSAATDNRSDSTNDPSLPAVPDAGASGFRLYPYHDAMHPVESGGVFYKQYVSHPYSDDVADVWQWQDVRLAGQPGFFSFQVLYFSSGDILFQYLPGNPGGAGATIGLQESGTGKAITYAANQDGAIPRDRNFGILFRRLVPAPAAPPTYTVTTLTDENDPALGQGAGNSLRETVSLSPAGSRIVFPASMAGQTIQLSSALSLGRVSIDGSSAPGLILSGRNLNSVVSVVNFDCSLSNLTIADGVSGGDGGGIYVNDLSSLTLTNVTVSNCRANATSGKGGGVFVSKRGQLLMTNCTLSGNSAFGGGGLCNARGTWSGALRAGVVTIRSSTLTANTAGGGGGGGVLNEYVSGEEGFFSVVSSIIAGNTTSGTGPDFRGIIISRGYNLLSGSAGVTGLAFEDIVAATPGLLPLADNGGPVRTHALQLSSPAVDSGTGQLGGFVARTDARGMPRNVDGDNDYSPAGGPEISLAGAVATQSSEYSSAFPAALGIDGNLTNFTHTAASDTNPSWTLTMPVNTRLDEVILMNRGDGCCQGRLRDITVTVFSDAGAATAVFTSPLLNPGDALVGPRSLRVVTGGVSARVVRVTRTPIPGQANDDGRVLSLGEVKLYSYPQDAIAVPTTGAVAWQSSDFPGGGAQASQAIDGNFTTFTHTATTDLNATFTLTLPANASVDEVVLANRLDCCAHRLRDITVTIYSDAAATSAVFTSPLLNPGNILNGPPDLRVSTGSLVNARVIKVHRANQAGAGDGMYLSIGELLLYTHTTRKTIGGPDIGAYELQQPFLVTTAADTVDPNDNKLSLREAVALAGGAGGGTVRFDPAAMGGSTITLASQIPVSAFKGLIIEGSQRPDSATFTVLGTGNAALRGGDLTDPENDGLGTGGTKGTKFNWVDITTSDTAKAFFADGTGGFADGAYEIFDNLVGAGTTRWVGSAPPQQVTVQFAHPVSLSHFTITSSNTPPVRDPLDWEILGSNDGLTFTPIFTRTGTSIWTDRNQVVLVTLPAPSPRYRFIRYAVSRTGGTDHALAEIEYFGPTADRITLSGNNATRHFQIDGGRVELRNLNLINGSSTSFGGSIYNRAELALMNCEVRNNSSTGQGGAIYGGAGSLTLVDNSTLHTNTAAAGSSGGAIASAGRLEMTQSTLSGNTADSGGGLFVSGGTAGLTSCTISRNASRNSTAGAGITRTGGTLTLGNTIVSGNVTGPDLAGTYLASTPNNFIGGDAKLAPLGTWGAPLPTHPLMAGSPALDAGSTGAWPVTTPADTVTPSLANSVTGSGPAAAFDNNPATVFSTFDPALVAWWSLDNSPADVVGGRTGTATGSIAFAQPPAPGLGGGSGSWGADGTARIDVPWAAALNPPGFTLTAWVYPTVVGGTWRNVLGNRATGPFRGYIVYLNIDGRWAFEIEATSGIKYLYGPVATANQWVHLAATYDGATQSAKFYINGALAASDTGPITLNPSAVIEIGRSFIGRMDDIGLWRMALTAAEIGAVRANGIRERTSGLTIRPSDPLRSVHALRFTAAPDYPDGDPASFILEGSRDGETFLELTRGDIPAFAARGSQQTVHFAGRSGWPFYRLAFPASRGGAAANRLQVAEVALLHHPATDQRGLERAADGNGDLVFTSDIGAVEARVMRVDTATDEINGPGNGATTFTSLREALQPVHQADVITFAPALSGQTIRLATAQGGQGSPLTVARLASIAGTALPDGLTIDAGGRPSAVIVSAGAGASLEGLTLRGAAGPGLDNAGTAWLTRSTVTANTATGTPAGVRNTGTLTVENSTVSGNASSTGNGGGIGNTGTLTILSSTITANSAASGGGVHHSGAGTATFTHSIVAGNTSAGTRDVHGTIVSAGWNVIGANNGSSGWIASDRTGTTAALLDAKLGALADNDGPAFTHALLLGSPALDAGNPLLYGFGLTDQRGFARVSNSAMDAGAFEQSAFAAIVTADRDGDGMSDDWERLYGFNPNAAADGATDADFDGQSNASEFAGRTVPVAAGSGFRLTSFTRTPGAGNSMDLDIVWDSVPGVIYSLWTSTSLGGWTAVPGTNIIAVASSTRIMVNVPDAQQRNFFQVRIGAAAGAGTPQPPPVEDTFIPVSNWEPATVVSGGNGTPVTRWNDAASALDDLFANSTPLFRTNATPTGQAAVEFRGGTFNDALADTVAAGKFGLNGATSFTAAVVFKPDGDSEVLAGTQFWQKSQLLNADLAGAGNDWGLSYAANTIWFGVGAGVGNDATISVPAGSAMPGAWWTAVVTWSADDGTGKPAFSAWLYNAEGHEVARTGPTDPNIIAGTTGRYHLPRANSGIALGSERGNLTARNFDGHIAAARLYPFAINRDLARTLAEILAGTYTRTAAAE